MQLLETGRVYHHKLKLLCNNKGHLLWQYPFFQTLGYHPVTNCGTMEVPLGQCLKDPLSPVPCVGDLVLGFKS